MQKLCIVAENIRSTYNVGSIFRTADGFSADVILIGITPRPLGGKNDARLPHIATKADKAISKTALGAEKSVNWQYFQNIETAIYNLRSNGYCIVAIEQAKNSVPISEMKISKPTALILGPEVEGLSQDILNICDEIFEIPMLGAKESYNVAVSAGIALYQARLTNFNR